ncbi:MULTISPECIES: hypothetical protein [unclassified Bradyrhizobium]|uniref:hypothetical protein n=1 Tax=unclassified Bradyrhizobium TaxID=2631580 RepID=UPI0033965851
MKRDWKDDAFPAAPVEPLPPPRKARTRARANPPAVVLPAKARPKPIDLKPWEPLAPKRRAKAADVITHDTDVTLEMAEQLIDEGIDIRAAGTMVELAALWNMRPALGRPTEAPRLTDRAPRGRKSGTPGRRMARIVFLGKYTTTGIVLREGEEAEEHRGAKIFLRRWKKKLARETLGKLQAPNKTMRQVFREILTDMDPGMSQDPEITAPYRRLLGDCAQLEECPALADTRFSELPGNIAETYVLFRIQQQIKSQSPDNPNPRTTDPATADGHVDSFFLVIRKFCEKYFLPTRTFKRLKFRRKPVRWLSFWQLWKLIRFCRGYALDDAGRIAGRHDMAKKYACVLRFILIYVYGGTRKNNIRTLLWGMDSEFGHIDVKAGEIQRQGPQARVTNKSRLPSDLIGSLRTLVEAWFEEDMAARKELGNPKDRYVHVLHDENGYQLAEKRMDTLLAEVCAAAGIPKVNAHALKHTGVTLVSRANMPVQDVEQAFSTNFTTLITTYRHLHGKWFARDLKPFRPDDLNLWRLRKFALRDREEVYAAAA